MPRPVRTKERGINQRARLNVPLKENHFSIHPLEKLLESFRCRFWPEQGSKGRQARNAGLLIYLANEPSSPVYPVYLPMDRETPTERGPSLSLSSFLQQPVAFVFDQQNVLKKQSNEAKDQPMTSNHSFSFSLSSYIFNVLKIENSFHNPQIPSILFLQNLQNTSFHYSFSIILLSQNIFDFCDVIKKKKERKNTSLLYY